MKLLLLVACLALASAAPRSSSYKSHKLYADVNPDAPPPKQGSRIVGGVEAEKHEFPHHVGVRWGQGNTFGFCSGTIISPDWVLTAGHCVDGASRWEIIAGAHYHAIHEQGQQRPHASAAILHQNYSSFIIHNDIALLKMETPLIFDNYVQAANLPENDPEVGAMVTISGWGSTRNVGLLSEVLMKVDVPIMSNEECKTYYNIIYDGHICVDTVGGHGTCSGDSGGPMVTPKAADGSYTAHGIVSFGSSAGCEAGDPDGLTRISYFREWIRMETGI